MIFSRKQYNKNNKNMHLFFSAKFLKNILSIVLLMLMSAIFFACGGEKNIDEQDVLENDKLTFANGISVFGVDISDKNHAEGKALVEEKINSYVSSAIINVVYDTQQFPITLYDLRPTTNLDEVLVEAMQYANSGTKEERKAAQELLLTTKKDYPLTFSPNEIDLESKINEFALLVYKATAEPDAILDKENDTIRFTEGAPGIELNIPATKSEIIQAVSNNTYPVNVQAFVNIIEPTKNLSDIKSKVSLLAKFSTSFDGNSRAERVHNITQGAQKINGLKLNPGESFSFNDYVGPRDAKNGWQMAATIVGGNKFEDDYGGGICQVSTTLFIAVAKAGLKIDKREKHSIPSSYAPIGMDATVAYGSKDFRFSNNKDYPVYVFTTVSSSSKKIEVSVYGPTNPEYDEIRLRKEEIKTIEPDPPELVESAEIKSGRRETVIERRKGFVVDVYKDYIKNGEVIKSEKMHSDTYRAVNGVYKVGIGEGATTPNIPAEDPNDNDIPDIPDEEPTPKPEKDKPKEEDDKPKDEPSEEPIEDIGEDHEEPVDVTDIPDEGDIEEIEG